MNRFLWRSRIWFSILFTNISLLSPAEHERGKMRRWLWVKRLENRLEPGVNPHWRNLITYYTSEMCLEESCLFPKRKKRARKSRNGIVARANYSLFHMLKEKMEMFRVKQCTVLKETHGCGRVCQGTEVRALVFPGVHFLSTLSN